jgi:antitoxin VapB
MYILMYPMYMALHIQDPETDQLARQLSAVTGETITHAVNTALRERLRTVQKPWPSEAEYIAGIEAIANELAKLPVLDTRSDNEILGYNEHGYFD